MKILIIPSEHFQTEIYPNGGIFQMHQALALVGSECKPYILNVGVVSPRHFFKRLNYKEFEVVSGIPCFRKITKDIRIQRKRSIGDKVSDYIAKADILYKKFVEMFGKPDLIHAHDPFFGGAIAWYISQQYGIPYFITFHSSSFITDHFSNNERFEIKKYIRNSSEVIVVSEHLKNYVQQYALERKISVISNVLDNSFFEIQVEALPESKEFVFIHVGSFDENKNQKRIIKAFHHFSVSHPNAILKIAGDGPMKSQLKEYVISLGLQGKVIFLGHLTRTLVKQEMTNATCFILASHFETFGVVLIEALSCGIPVISTRSGGPNEIVNSSNGILVSDKDGITMEDAMDTISKSNYKKEDLINDCIARFGSKTFIDKIIPLYKNYQIQNDLK